MTLFDADVDQTPQEPPPRRAGEPPHPSPFDGLIHFIKDVKADKGARTIAVRCGAKMPTYRTHETLGGATAWESDVTCPGCRHPLLSSVPTGVES